MHSSGLPAVKFVSSCNQCPHLPIGDRALQHPKAAIGMDPADSILAQHLHGSLNPLGDAIGRFHFVVFDVDHAHAKADRWLEIAKDLQFVIAAPSEFQQQVIAF